MMRSLVVAIIACVACGACGASQAPATSREPVALRVATAVADGLARGDANAFGGWFARGARVELVGDRGDRDAASVGPKLVAAFAQRHVDIGRVWIDRAGTTAVIEIVFSAQVPATAGSLDAGSGTGPSAPRDDGRSGAHDTAAAPPADRGVAAAERRQIAVAGAAVVTFANERVTNLRLYLDLVTALGQLDRARVPAQLSVRGLEPPPARGTFIATGSAREAANLEVTNATWSALDAHDADRVMATASDDYRYYDYAAPKALSRTETHDMVAGFLAVATGFRIARKPVQFAAGDFVVTEMVERAAPIGKQIELHGLDIKRLRDGRVVEEWQYSNYFEVLGQLAGVVKPELP